MNGHIIKLNVVMKEELYTPIIFEKKQLGSCNDVSGYFIKRISLMKIGVGDTNSFANAFNFSSNIFRHDLKLSTLPIIL